MEKFLDQSAKKIIQCPKCEKKYVIDPSEVSVEGIRITCPNCDKVFIVRKDIPKRSEDVPKRSEDVPKRSEDVPKRSEDFQKRSEDFQKRSEDFKQCCICGEPPTIHLDTDKPICERCKTLEKIKAIKIPKSVEGKEALLRLDCVLSMLSDGYESLFNLSSGAFYDVGVSFFDLSTNNFQKMALMLRNEKQNISIDNLDESAIEDALSRLDERDFIQKAYSTDAPPDQDKKHLKPEEKSAYSSEPQIPEPEPPEPEFLEPEPPEPEFLEPEPPEPEFLEPEPPESADPSQVADPESEAPPKETSSVWKKLNVTNGKLEEALGEETLSDATASVGKWHGRGSHRKKDNIVYMTKPNSPPSQNGPEKKTEEIKHLVSLIMVLLSEANKKNTKWLSPLAFADLANDGFLSVARSAGKAVRVIHSGTVGGSSRVKQGLSRVRKMRKSEKPSCIRKIKESEPANDTPEESGSSPPEVRAKSIIEGLTREELDLLIDEASRESGINIRDLMKKLL